jgi:CRP-like cAMP-binding protein
MGHPPRRPIRRLTRQTPSLAFVGDFEAAPAIVELLRAVSRVRATSPVRCLANRRADFTALLEAEPRIALAMLPGLARRHAQAMGMA